MKNDADEIVDLVPITDSRAVARTSSERQLVEAPVGVRVIPRHRVAYSLTLVVNGEPHPISDQHAADLQMFASVDQKIGKVTNSGDRKHALVVLLPRGAFACIDLDDPDAVPADAGKSKSLY